MRNCCIQRIHPVKLSRPREGLEHSCSKSGQNGQNGCLRFRFLMMALNFGTQGQQQNSQTSKPTNQVLSLDSSTCPRNVRYQVCSIRRYTYQLISTDLNLMIIDDQPRV